MDRPPSGGSSVFSASTVEFNNVGERMRELEDDSDATMDLNNVEERMREFAEFDPELMELERPPSRDSSVFSDESIEFDFDQGLQSDDEEYEPDSTTDCNVEVPPSPTPQNPQGPADSSSWWVSQEDEPRN
jgi:hypothetical protein